MTDLILNEKGKSWFMKMKNQIAKYIPYKGAQCPLCKTFCKTRRTEKDTGKRFHRCDQCGNTFHSFLPKVKVGKNPTLLDKVKVEELKIDKRTPQRSSDKRKGKKSRTKKGG